MSMLASLKRNINQETDMVTRHRCDRCNTLLNPENPWLCLTVHPSEDQLLNPPENGTLDLCFGCEKDLVAFMAGKVFDDFLERRP